MSNFIILLDDISNAMYKRLKADADVLKLTRNLIKCKQKEIASYYDLWMYFEAYDFEDEAEVMYRKKLMVEVQVAALEKQLKAQTDKVKIACRERSA